MSSLYIKVEAVAGSAVEEVCEDMITLSEKLGIMVTLNFNGVSLNAVAGDYAGEMADKYFRQLENNHAT